jgi:hypothetical protein
VLAGGTDSDKQRRGEVGPWVGEMAGEVGDPIWSPVKEEAHQRAVFTGAWLGWRGTAVRGGVRWWRFRKVVRTRAVRWWWSVTARKGISGREVGAGEMA